jgi:hypothetical protein
MDQRSRGRVTSHDPFLFSERSLNPRGFPPSLPASPSRLVVVNSQGARDEKAVRVVLDALRLVALSEEEAKIYTKRCTLCAQSTLTLSLC